MAGRPTTVAREGEKATLGIRAAPSLKMKLLAAAKVSARSLSAEAEFRLEQSFRDDEVLQRLDEIEERWGEEWRRIGLRARLNDRAA